MIRRFGVGELFKPVETIPKRRATAGLIKRIVSSICQRDVTRVHPRIVHVYTSEPRRISREETPRRGRAKGGWKGRIERIYVTYHMYIEMGKADAKPTGLLPNKTRMQAYTRGVNKAFG